MCDSCSLSLHVQSLSSLYLLCPYPLFIHCPSQPSSVISIGLSQVLYSCTWFLLLPVPNLKIGPHPVWSFLVPLSSLFSITPTSLDASFLFIPLTNSLEITSFYSLWLNFSEIRFYHRLLYFLGTWITLQQLYYSHSPQNNFISETKGGERVCKAYLSLTLRLTSLGWGPVFNP